MRCGTSPHGKITVPTLRVWEQGHVIYSRNYASFEKWLQVYRALIEIELLAMRHQVTMHHELGPLGPTKSEFVRISSNFTCDELLHLEPSTNKIRGHR